MAPGPRQGVASHPRRLPAQESVSLRHTPPNSHSSTSHYHQRAPSQASYTIPSSDRANPPSSTSQKPLNHKQSSGESSDAGKWFENSNNNVMQSNPSFVDNDPPFFLRHSSSSETPPEALEQRMARLHPQSAAMAYRPGLMHLGTEGSSTEDFRSVIDDLTVANKRLKQKLRKYEKLYDAHLQEEKLFEVRFHGLPDHKKKELEETLRNFAVGLDESPASESPPTGYPLPLERNVTSSHTSTRFAESGYASLSVSGQNSASAPSGNDSNSRKTSKSAFNRQQENVQSYLHDIPPGLLPKHTTAMTDKSKKKLVVRRLEQIFAGKRPAAGGHPQPLQQQEVAQLAARADRQAKEASGQRARQEGVREARIMPSEADDEDTATMDRDPPDSLQRCRHPIITAERELTGSGSPDQRPTRPLDLDPYRAQVPSENMEYIRHLGFTPPDMISGQASEDGHGWIYLNLLVNMAQLHTINVTPDFVKDAVAEYSSKFELSHDGRKIRWKGGHDVTRTSSDSSSEHLSSASPDENVDIGKSNNKRAKTSHSASGGLDPVREARRNARLQKEKAKNKFAYTPLFFHKVDSDEDEDFYTIDQISTPSSMPAHLTGDSSRLGSSAIRSSSSRKRRDDGPIIFYNKARFCTDLSGDRRGFIAGIPASYNSLTSRPVGVKPGTVSEIDQILESNDQKGPLDDPSIFENQMEIDQYSGSSDTEIGFPLELSQGGNSPKESREAFEFEASGIGGVQPRDNFAINVRLRQTRLNEQSGVVAIRRIVTKPKLYSRKIFDVLNNRHSQTLSEQTGGASSPVISQEIISISHKDLPSSTLPPASFLPFDSSSGDADSDLDSDISSSPSRFSSASNPAPATTLQLLNISPTHVGAGAYSLVASEGPVDSGKDEDESDGSLDLLATARALDPKTVHANERAYDSNMANRLAEEIPAGSSAATAGGGSGFNSPDSVATGDDAEGQKRPSTAGGSGVVSRTRSLKRARTSDSLAAVQHGKTPKLE
ncbi:hypothetical protein AOQ84DRAFT_357211 [Glonium stellatum]|uniref:Frequency clock protein n=1 Tax=Glonium stellatum TaxID=574774 RepID=A0A8E2EQ92_9PEZI|nr:hypothetical protein AOQ84DRAFT_357211 [Glonium stellatum]